MILRRGADTWTPYSAMRFEVVDQSIRRIKDYIHCPWILAAATNVTVFKA